MPRWLDHLGTTLASTLFVALLLALAYVGALVSSHRGPGSPALLVAVGVGCQLLFIPIGLFATGRRVPRGAAPLALGSACALAACVLLLERFAR
jgi:hypothetical protein